MVVAEKFFIIIFMNWNSVTLLQLSGKVSKFKHMQYKREMVLR